MFLLMWLIYHQYENENNIKAQVKHEQLPDSHG